MPAGLDRPTDPVDRGRVAVVTGAGGYLGGRLVEELLARQFTVRPVLRRRCPWLDHLDPIVGPFGSDFSLAVQACRGAEVVFHLAGANESRCATSTSSTVTETAGLASLMARAARRAGVRRVVYASTIHVNRLPMPLAAGQGVTPVSGSGPGWVAYALARAAAERALSAVLTPMDRPGTDLVCLRIANGVGAPVDPRVDRWSLVGNDLARQAVNLGQIEVRSPQAWRDFVAVSEIVRVLAEVAEDSTPPGTYDLLSGRWRQIGELANLIAEEVGRRSGRKVLVPPTRPPSDPTRPPSDPTRPPDQLAGDPDLLAAVGISVMDRLVEAVAETVEFCLQAAKLAASPSLISASGGVV